MYVSLIFTASTRLKAQSNESTEGTGSTSKIQTRQVNFRDFLPVKI